MKILILGMILFLNNCSKTQTSWEIKGVNQEEISFKNNKVLKTNLFDLKFLFFIESEKKHPFIIVSGKSCENCDENVSIYVHKLDNLFLDSSNTHKYSYPGKIFDYFNNQLIAEINTYWGKCWNNNSIILWDQKNLKNDGTFLNERFIVQILDGEILERRIDSNSLINWASCKKIEGIDRTSEP